MMVTLRVEARVSKLGSRYLLSAPLEPILPDFSKDNLEKHQESNEKRGHVEPTLES